MTKRSPKHVRIEFSASQLTHYGGVYLLQRFFQKLNLRSRLSQYVQFEQRNNTYTIAQHILALVYSMTLGLTRIETTHLLQRNGVFQYLTGFATYPHPTTLRRFLLRMTPSAVTKLRRLYDTFLVRLMSKPKPPTKIVFDMDSTVVTLYGKQEYARKGYNPFKPGRVSYHPLLCFNGLTKDFWHGELRPGNVHTASGVLDLLTASFAKVPASVQHIFVRADKGFYDHKTVEYLETEKAFFAIVAKLTRPVKAKLSSLSYRKYSFGIQTAEFSYQPTTWKSKHRFIVIRRPLPEEATDQLTLFSVGKFSYQVIVTNLTLAPINVWRFYNQRAAIELTIKELKENYPLAKIPTKHFAANEAYFHLLLFSYNLINWFKRLCLPSEFRALTLSTLRHHLLCIPGELTRSRNRPTLKLPASFPYQDAFHYATKAINKLAV